MAYKTILLKSCCDIRLERAAGGTVTPGHLVQLNSGNTFSVHASAAQKPAPLMVALEDELQGKGIDDDYVSTYAQRVQAAVLRPGDEFYAILATSQTISIGDKLESAGDGTVREMALSSVDDPQNPVAVAMEAVTTTGAVARIRCMAI